MLRVYSLMIFLSIQLHAGDHPRTRAFACKLCWLRRIPSTCLGC